MYHRFYEPGLFGWLFPLLMLALLAGAVVLLVMAFRRPSEKFVVDADPMRRAARRYAAGEIERVEFERIQRDLSGPGDDPLRNAALRLARGEIGIGEFDEMRSRLTALAADQSSGAEST